MNGPDDKTAQELQRIQLGFFILGISGLLLALPALIQHPDTFLRSYLFSYLFWIDLSLGSLGMLMIYFLTAGAWGAATRRILQAASRTVWLFALLFLPILIGIHRLYPWTDPRQVQADPHLQHKKIYLNIPFFTLRYLLYFLGWCLLSHFLNRWARAWPETAGALPDREAELSRLKRLSAGGLVLYGLSASFASFDWRMSLEPKWFSTIYGMIYVVSQGLGAWAFTLIVFVILTWLFGPNGRPASRRLSPYSPKSLRDQGNILLAFVMTWAYLSIIQYIVIWSGNLPEEVTWFLHRMQNGWGVLAVLLAIFQFAIPFFLLLFRGTKIRLETLLGVAGAVLALRIADHFWYVAPAFYPSHFRIHWADVTLFFGIGGLWLGFFFTYLRRQPAFAFDDPDWPGTWPMTRPHATEERSR